MRYIIIIPQKQSLVNTFLKKEVYDEDIIRKDIKIWI